MNKKMSAEKLSFTKIKNKLSRSELKKKLWREQEDVVVPPIKFAVTVAVLTLFVFPRAGVAGSDFVHLVNGSCRKEPVLKSKVIYLMTIDHRPPLFVVRGLFWMALNIHFMLSLSLLARRLLLMELCGYQLIGIVIY